jgi:hypothetical protein
VQLHAPPSTLRFRLVWLGRGKRKMEDIRPWRMLLASKPPWASLGSASRAKRRIPRPFRLHCPRLEADNRILPRSRILMLLQGIHPRTAVTFHLRYMKRILPRLPMHGICNPSAAPPPLLPRETTDQAFKASDSSLQMHIRRYPGQATTLETWRRESVGRGKDRSPPVEWSRRCIGQEPSCATCPNAS